MNLKYINQVRKFFIKTELKIILKLKLIDTYQPITGFKNHDALRLKGTIDRWNAIEKELGGFVGSAMDIGSNNGYFTFKLASMGYLCLGIESSKALCYICNLTKEINTLENAIFLNAKLEDVIHRLPKFEVTIFLSLFHHIVREKGFEHASDIFSQLLSKTDRVMFFETGQSNEINTTWARDLPDMGKEPKVWLQDYLIKAGATRVKWLGDFESFLSPVPRSLFAVYAK